MTDPDFYYGADEDYIYDTYDSIIESPDEDFEDMDELPLSELEPGRVDDDYLDATAMGMAFALADEILDERKQRNKRAKYDVDENTDRENAKMVSLLQNADRAGESRLRPFEQYIDDICKGKRRLFEG